MRPDAANRRDPHLTSTRSRESDSFAGCLAASGPCHASRDRTALAATCADATRSLAALRLHGSSRAGKRPRAALGDSTIRSTVGTDDHARLVAARPLDANRHRTGLASVRSLDTDGHLADLSATRTNEACRFLTGLATVGSLGTRRDRPGFHRLAHQLAGANAAFDRFASLVAKDRMPAHQPARPEAASSSRDKAAATTTVVAALTSTTLASTTLASTATITTAAIPASATTPAAVVVVIVEPRTGNAAGEAALDVMMVMPAAMTPMVPDRGAGWERIVGEVVHQGVSIRSPASRPTSRPARRQPHSTKHAIDLPTRCLKGVFRLGDAVADSGPDLSGGRQLIVGNRIAQPGGIVKQVASLTLECCGHALAGRCRRLLSPCRVCR